MAQDITAAGGPPAPAQSPVQPGGAAALEAAGGAAPAAKTKKELREQRRWEKRRNSRFWKHRDVNHGAKSFADGLNVYKVIWVFVLGCLIGVAFETLYVHFQEGVWMRRSGMLYGPFNQVYGFGAVLFTLLLYRFRKKNAMLIFLASALIGGVFEYLCSWLQQLVFGSVSWEYSDMPANIGGRTNVYYMLGWGLMGLLFITHIWPFLSEMIERIPNFLGRNLTAKTLTIVLAAALAADLLLSGAAVFRAGQRQEGVPARNAVGRWLDDVYPDDVMAEKYPSMEFVGRPGKPAGRTPPGGGKSAGSAENSTSRHEGGAA